MKGSTRGAPAVLDSLRSNYERDAPPRGVERESVLIHLGLSMFVTVDAAAERATTMAGAWQRTLRACASSQANGFHFAETGARVHRTVWGRPLQLLACVADILPVGAL